MVKRYIFRDDENFWSEPTSSVTTAYFDMLKMAFRPRFPDSKPYELESPADLTLQHEETVVSGGMSWTLRTCPDTELSWCNVDLPVRHVRSFLKACRELGLTPQFEFECFRWYPDSMGNETKRALCRTYSVGRKGEADDD